MTRRKNTGTPAAPSYMSTVQPGPRDKREAPAYNRNIAPILAVLNPLLPGSGRVLEVASGTGQHVTAFAAAHPGLAFVPSDFHAVSRASIAAWTDELDLGNVAAPLDIDVTRRAWHEAVTPPFAAVIAINLLHIAPWAALPGLLQGAGALVAPENIVFIYGPFKLRGAHTAPTNEQFDLSLRQRNSDWGLRDIEEVGDIGAKYNLVLIETIPMPANNFALILKKEH